MKPAKIDFCSYKNILILTGAGVSVASGIRPFRGKDGLWNDPDIARLSEMETLKSDPLAVWKFWMATRKTVLASLPNPAHLAIARIEKSLLHDQNFLMTTQNIDGLHQKAGSRRVVELHGNALRSRCSTVDCSSRPFEDRETSEDLRFCPVCGSPIRVDIVLFGEDLPVDAIWPVKKMLRECDLFISIGTSGTVSPASNFVSGAKYAGARTIYINLDPMDPPNPQFDEVILGRAEEILPDLFEF
jgi:NAD-dependent deacetylase